MGPLKRGGSHKNYTDSSIKKKKLTANSFLAHLALCQNMIAEVKGVIVLSQLNELATS